MWYNRWKNFKVALLWHRWPPGRKIALLSYSFIFSLLSLHLIKGSADRPIGRDQPTFCSSQSILRDAHCQSKLDLQDQGVFFPDSFPAYPFIDHKQNRIFSPSYLQPFLQKLNELKTGQRGQLRIAHLGDSHVQADFMPSALRHLFQDKFGDAGRGLVFFYQVAETHGPLDFITNSPQRWTARRRIFQKEGPAMGISGMGIATSESMFSLELESREAKNNLHFNKVTLFHDDKGQYQYSWGEQAEDGHPFLTDPQSQFSIAYLPEIKQSIRIHGKRRKGAQEAEVYGLLLEDTTRPGILYNMMGVNGATYYHFNRAAFFTQQMGRLRADLILITLGTNEALQARFYPEQFRREVRGLLQNLKAVNPQCQLLLMTNPSVLAQKSIAAAHTLPVRDIILEIAQQEEAAVWDWYAVMGSKESIRDWHQAGLAYEDFIHFTKKGYILQARLLFEAIMKEYRAAY